MIGTITADELRFLTFRPLSSAVRTNWQAYLAFGLFFAWLAGIGRYWDNPKAELWQHLGLGSVVYVFVLALLLWGIIAPLRPRNWTYRNVLLFVALTSPPAVLYAIPVERFMDMDAARITNAWFLAVVAAWRVALLAVFLTGVSGLSWFRALVGTLLPLTLIVLALTLLNLEHVVFNIMSGIDPVDRSQNDVAYQVVMMLSFYSFLASPVLIVAYALAVHRAWRGGQTIASIRNPASSD